MPHLQVSTGNRIQDLKMTDFAKEVLPVNLEDEMKQSYLDYAMSVIVGRALPDDRVSDPVALRQLAEWRAGMRRQVAHAARLEEQAAEQVRAAADELIPLPRRPEGDVRCAQVLRPERVNAPGRRLHMHVREVL